ncbi:MAG: hypothetical protein RLZZ262_573 [Bacteroidota bacterium]|jgi:hypothetical protein
MIYRIALIALLFSVATTTKAQTLDTLLLLSGQEVLIEVSNDSGTVVVGKVAKKNGKTREVSIHKLDIFSHSKANGQKVIYYAEDWVQEHYLSEQEMEVYLVGAGDAKNGYKAKYVLLIGVVFSGTLAYLGGDGWGTVFLPTLVYMGGQFIGKIQIDHSSMRDPKYMYNDLYAAGYEKPARSKKVRRAALGGASGAALGLILSFLINNGASVY